MKENTNKYFDNVGNELNIGDKVFVLVPKTYASYRIGTIIGFKNEDYTYGDILVEYDDGRMYCNLKWFDQRKNKDIKFSHKFTKAWRASHDIIKYKDEYINN